MLHHEQNKLYLIRFFYIDALIVNDFIHFKLISSSIVKIVEYYLMEFLIFNET